MLNFGASKPRVRGGPGPPGPPPGSAADINATTITNWIQSCLTKESRDRVCFETEICPRPRSTGTVILQMCIIHSV